MIKFELETQFDENIQKINSFNIAGSVKNAKFNLIGYDNLENINFNFVAKNNIIKISDLNFNYQNIKLISESIEAITEKPNTYFIRGDIKNNETSLDPNLFLKIFNINQDFISEKNKILISSKNFFSFELNKKNKVEDVKIDSFINFNEIHFKNKYQNIIFLKNGKINLKYENGKLNGDLDSNFAFNNNLNVKDRNKNNIVKLSLSKENNSNIKIKGNITNEKTLLNSKILLNFLELDQRLIANRNINIETDNKFELEIKNAKVENYLVNSTINLDKLEFDKKFQDIIYLRNIKSKLTFKNKSIKGNLKSNYSFLNNNYNNKLDDNIFSLNLDKSNKNEFDVEIFLETKNNNINTNEFSKYLYLKDTLENQTINLNSNFKFKATIDNKFNLTKIKIKSDLNFDNLNINYKSNLIKKYINNYDNKITINNPKISFEYSNEIIDFQIDGKYLLKEKEDNFFIRFRGNKQNFEFYSLIDLKYSVLNFNEIEYYKKKNIPSKLLIEFNNSNKNFNFKSINLLKNKIKFIIKNLNISEEYKIIGFDELQVNFINENKILNKFKIERNSNNYNFSGYQLDGEKLVQSLMKSKNKNKNKLAKLFNNINTSIVININKIFLEDNEYLNNFEGIIDIKNNELFSSKINASLNKINKFSYSYRTTVKNEKITNIIIEEPKPFINNYKFIKGFDEGSLKLNSFKIDNKSRSNLKINNFKVKEVPVLAKILTLASLQGIADLLTGEGIRFDKFEMDFKTKNNLTEIDEMYAIGPAISIMMEGYIEKDRLSSLRGTLVPATTINNTLRRSLLGNLLVGSKTGEGVFWCKF